MFSSHFKFEIRGIRSAEKIIDWKEMPECENGFVAVWQNGSEDFFKKKKKTK